MKLIKTSVGCGLLISAMMLGAVGCNAAPKTPEEQQKRLSSAASTLALMERDDPGIRGYVNNAYAYAILPNIGEGGAGIGGAHGTGEVYRNDGTLIGYVNMILVSAGPQIGGREYAELIVFRTESAFHNFTNNNLGFLG